MAVMMVTGNAGVLPTSLEAIFRPVRTMTATIAAEMGEVARGSVHYHALFADLLGEPADSDPADQESRPAVAARNTSQQFTASDPEEMTK